MCTPAAAEDFDVCLHSYLVLSTAIAVVSSRCSGGPLGINSGLVEIYGCEIPWDGLGVLYPFDLSADYFSVSARLGT